MADEQEAHASLAGDLVEQVQDGALDGDVERGRGLVGDEQGGRGGERHGQGDALTLAARDLVGEGPGDARGVGQGDFGECAVDGLTQGGASQTAVAAQRQRDLLAEPHERVERGRGVLEHHGDLRAAQRA